MKLTKLKVDDFKRVKSVELDIADLNILVGGNGSGKSSIIQAIHLACCVMRQVERVEKGKTSTVGIDELDYLPSNNYKLLGHKTVWGNMAGTPSSDVALTFQREQAHFTASCELRSARNAGISITGSVPNELTETLRKKRRFFSAYIPGISGIPNKEEKRSKKVVLKACSYGDSNIILRNALLLLKQQDLQNITRIETWISQIAEPMKIAVTHEDDKDLSISCDVTVGSESRPIELIGTGYLQLIQIFSYILLFEPGILLIDEPDIHLHPTVQEKLVKALATVARERDLRILLTTHSPFVVRGAPPDAKVYWVNEGTIESKDRRAVELALGWGAFGKKVIVVSEDSNTDLLKKLIYQWPGIEQFVAYFPGTGYRNITTPKQAAEITTALGGKYKLLVHRDRDSLTDDEVKKLEKTYADEGVTLWFPDHSDIEAYFCQPLFIKSLLGCTDEQASQYVEAALVKRATEIETKFKAQRAEHNKEVYGEGGSPTNDVVWQEFQQRALKGARGKTVFAELKTIPGNVFRPEKILEHQFVTEIAPSLRLVLQQLLA
ncbi:MAG: AAA family ATPase [Nitrososphaera sp.]|nr:AAA family ATPase [Nitrososphaera sp.]